MLSLSSFFHTTLSFSVSTYLAPSLLPPLSPSLLPMSSTCPPSLAWEDGGDKDTDMMPRGTGKDTATATLKFNAKKLKGEKLVLDVVWNCGKLVGLMLLEVCCACFQTLFLQSQLFLHWLSAWPRNSFSEQKFVLKHQSHPNCHQDKRLEEGWKTYTGNALSFRISLNLFMKIFSLSVEVKDPRSAKHQTDHLNSAYICSGNCLL